MPRTRNSLVFLAATLLLGTFAFGGCSSSAVLPVESGDHDSGSSTTDDGNEPLPGIDDTPAQDDPDEAAVPEVTSITPKKATVGSVGPSIVVSGNNFVPRSIVQLDGAPLATSFVSAKELRATIPSGKLAVVATLRISVGTAPPGGGASKEVVFSVENPAPDLTALSPLSVLAGAGDTKLDVTGASFVTGSKIVFGGADLVTTWNGSTSLSATIPASLLATSGSVPVTVVSPDPGGGTSSAISFTVSNPDAAITSINPSAAFVGSAAFDMTVSGSGFVNGSSVLFNGTALTTTFQSASKLKASVPSSALTAAGDFPIAVKNPPPGGGVSTPIVFRVQYPQPSLSDITPDTVSAGAGPTDITVKGVGFFVTSQITFDNAPAATTYIDATHLKATVSANQLANATTIAVRVVNSPPGGGTSSALSLTVANGVPSITKLDPSIVTAGSADRLITIFGSGFVSTSSVKSNGQAVSASYVSGGQLTATIPANHLLNPGTVSIVVTNPAPGGGTSSPASLVVGCDTTGVNYALGAVGTVTTVTTNFNNTNLMSRWEANGGSCQSVKLYSDVLQPGRYTVVQNTAGVPVTLSAWADCSTITGGDAFLTYYRRPTVPANDTDRLGCAFVVAEGTNGLGGYASPDSGGSAYCPGLTKANGGGLQLGVCEKAVIHIQPYDYASTTYKAPPRLKFKPETP